MNNDYLVHYGVKGMKWGVRRDRRVSGGGRPHGPNTPKKKISSDDIRETKKLVDATSNVVTQGKRVNSEVQKMKSTERAHAVNRKIKNDLDSMSDAELREIVNRLNMEERYSQVMNSRYSDVGKNRVETMLDYAGAALTVGSTALSIALAIKELKK